jgi:hypothetical protein
MSLIVQLRGTHGSGKTSIVKHLLAQYNAEALYDTSKKKPKILGYRFTSPKISRPVYVPGTYENACGGLDGCGTQEQQVELILKAYRYGHVLCVGVLSGGVSPAATFPRMLLEAVGAENYAMCFLDTPLQLCIDRVKARRAERGDDRPFDPKNVISKYHSVVGSIQKSIDAGCRVYMLNHQDPVPQVLGLLESAE